MEIHWFYGLVQPFYICGCPAIPRERLVGTGYPDVHSGRMVRLGAISKTLNLSGQGRLLQEFHDATADCELRGERQIVCHGDASPCNCVFVNGIPAAFIDFDTAHGERREDVGYATWLWLDLGNSELEPTFQARRLAKFVAAYGGFALTDALRLCSMPRRNSQTGPARPWESAHGRTRVRIGSNGIPGARWRGCCGRLLGMTSPHPCCATRRVATFRCRRRMKEMQKEQGDKPILSWETVNTTRDKKGLSAQSTSLSVRKYQAGGW